MTAKHNIKGHNIYEYLGEQRKKIALTGEDLGRVRATIGMIPSRVSTILDVGCGSGAFVDHLASDYKSYGIDYAFNSAKNLRGKGIQGSSICLPFRDNAFDLVLCCEVLEHLEGDLLTKTIAELARVSSKYVLISVPYKENLGRLQTRCSECKHVFHIWGHVNSFSEKTLDKMFHSVRSLSTRFFGKRPPYLNRYVLWANQRLGGRWTEFALTTLCPRCGNAKFERERRTIVSVMCGAIHMMTSTFIPATKKNWILKLYAKQKSTLVLTYNWPPDASVGAVRPIKLVKQLSRQGIKTIIVTVKKKYYEKCNSTTDEGHDLIYRTGCLPHLTHVYIFLKRAIAKVFGLEKHLEEDTLRGSYAVGPETTRSAPFETIKRIILSLLYTPDEYLGWLPFAVLRSGRVIKDHDVTCIISTGPPFTTHLIGLVLKLIYGTRWIADFRDPWSANEQRPFMLQSLLSSQLHLALERSVLRNADRVVCVTPAMTEWYRKHHLDLPADKWVTITNGYDEEDFRELKDVRHYPKFTISYMGIFEYDRSPEILLRAAGDLLKEGFFNTEQLAIRFIGKCRYANGHSVSEMGAKYGLTDVLKIIDLVPRKEALREMRRSHVLLLLANRQSLQVPSKVYEYMAANGRILAVTEEGGATADLIKNIGRGEVIPLGDYQAMKNVLRAWYGQFKQSDGFWDAEMCMEGNVDEYEWRELGRRYALLLGDAVSKR